MLTKRFTKEELFKKVDTVSIFNYYFGPFTLRSKTYPSIFRKDNNPSTGFFINNNNECVYSDLATGEKWGAIGFVMELFNLGYQEALEKIGADFGLIKKEGYTAVARVVKRKPIEKVEKVIQITTSGWNHITLKFWNEYSIDKNELQKHHIYPIKTLFINGFEIKNIENHERYAFHFNEGDKEYLKIYSPFDKKFKWVSNCPLKIPFGYKDLPYESKTLVITKSMKDLMVCRKYFSDVIALQNESPASWSSEILDPIINKYDNVIVWFDNDDAGINALDYYKDKFTTFTFPVRFRKEFGVKDPADFIKLWGKDNLKIYLEKNEVFKRAMLAIS